MEKLDAPLISNLHLVSNWNPYVNTYLFGWYFGSDKILATIPPD